MNPHWIIAITTLVILIGLFVLFVGGLLRAGKSEDEDTMMKHLVDIKPEDVKPLERKQCPKCDGELFLFRTREPWWGCAKCQYIEDVKDSSGIEQLEARQPHKLEVEGSSPSPATSFPRYFKFIHSPAILRFDSEFSPGVYVETGNISLIYDLKFVSSQPTYIKELTEPEAKALITSPRES